MTEYPPARRAPQQKPKKTPAGLLRTTQSGVRERVLPALRPPPTRPAVGLQPVTVNQNFNGVDLATAKAASHRELALALTSARVGG